MILRRFTDALRRQDWFTVTIETLMVVLGVFLGLQVNSWNEARADAERSREYLSRIRAELVSDMTQLERHRGLWQVGANEGYVAISYAETGARGAATDWEILRAFLHASQSFQLSFVDTTYSELLSAGELRLIPDADLRSALADYYVLVAARRGGLGPYQLWPEYREMVRGRMRSDIMRYYWQACYQQSAGVTTFIDCPPPEGVTGIAEIIRELAADQEILDALRYWADTQRMAVELAGVDLGRAQSLIDRVDDQL